MRRKVITYSEKPCQGCDGTGVFSAGLPCLRCDGTGLVYTRDLLQTPVAVRAREANRRKADARRAARVEKTGSWSAEHADVIDRIYRVDNEFMHLMRNHFEKHGILTAAQVVAVRRG